ncbi:pyruvate kinase alpha/beta domain-containing protein [Mesorhizobium sp. ESP6-5]|uniref:pyruvate kinase alpha/beta domain-containing protein n=1 Tax=Mesorhizobium sp. ESP6-5 TaxID=2876623 RepID=UPI0021E2CF37|nr:pyruvate kinase alpha/beta domain-containing protein [Mesorhizobium sp. ESP6-5]
MAAHQAMPAPATSSSPTRLRRCPSTAAKDGFASAGERVLVVAGIPFGTPGATNMVRIAVVGEPA